MNTLKSFSLVGWFLVGTIVAVPAAVPEPKIVLRADDSPFPSEVKPVGDYASFVPKGEFKSVTYIGLSGIDPFPSSMLKDARAFVLPVRGLESKRYKFVAVASTAVGEQSRYDFVVVVGDSPAPDPPPDPPEATSQFVKDLRAAYKLETAADKALLPKLREFYSKSATEVSSQTTWVGLFVRMKAIANEQGTAGHLPNVGAVIEAEVKKTLPFGQLDPNLQMTDQDKKNAKKTFEYVSASLFLVK